MTTQLLFNKISLKNIFVRKGQFYYQLTRTNLSKTLLKNHQVIQQTKKNQIKNILYFAKRRKRSRRRRRRRLILFIKIAALYTNVVKHKMFKLELDCYNFKKQQWIQICFLSTTTTKTKSEEQRTKSKEQKNNRIKQWILMQYQQRQNDAAVVRRKQEQTRTLQLTIKWCRSSNMKTKSK